MTGVFQVRERPRFFSALRLIGKTFFMRIYCLRLVIATVLFMAGNTLSAQVNFMEGAIINNSGDTITGFIDWRYKDKNPRFIRFRKLNSKTADEYGPSDIAGFMVDGEFFVARTVPVIVRKERKQVSFDANIFDSQIVEKECFLNVLCQGRANLYYLKDEDDQPHYFIETDTIFDELINTVSFRNDNFNFLRIEEFKVQLREYMADCKHITSIIEKTKFTGRSLTELFENYSKCSYVEPVFLKKPDKMGVVVSALTGFTSYAIHFEGTGALFQEIEKLDFGRSLKPSGGFGVEIIFPRPAKKLSFYNELAYHSANMEASFFTKVGDNYLNTDYQFIMNYLNFSSMFRYTFLSGKFKPFVAAGITNSLAVRNFNEKVITGENPSDDKILIKEPVIEKLRNYSMGYALSTGVKFKRITGEIRIGMGNGIETHSYGYFTSRSNYAGFLFGYGF